MFLNPYDIRSCEMKVDAVLKMVENIQTAVVPRKKFVFKSRRKDSGIFFNVVKKEPEVAEEVEESPAERSEQQVEYSLEFSSLSKTSHTIHVESQPYNMSSVRLKNISSSTFTLLDIYSFARLSNLKDSTIYLGIIKGPLYVEDVHNCKIFATAKQVRRRRTACTAKPIAPHCVSSS